MIQYFFLALLLLNFNWNSTSTVAAAQNGSGSPSGAKVDDSTNRKGEKSREIECDVLGTKLTIACDAFREGNFHGARGIVGEILDADPKNQDAIMIREMAQSAIDGKSTLSVIQENADKLKSWRYIYWEPRLIHGYEAGIPRHEWLKVVAHLRGKQANSVLLFDGADEAKQLLKSLRNKNVQINIAKDTKLPALLAYLKKTLGVSVSVSDAAEKQILLDPSEVDFETKLEFPLSADCAMSMVLRNHPDLTWTIENEGIVITSKFGEAEEELYTGVYDIGDLLYGITRRVSSPETPFTTEVKLEDTASSASQETAKSNTFGVVNYETTELIFSQELTQIIRDIIEPASWETMGVHIDQYQTNLIVTNRKSILLAVNEFLDCFRNSWDTHVSLTSPLNMYLDSSDAIERRLRDTPNSIKTAKLSVAEFTSQLGRMLQLNVVVDNQPSTAAIGTAVLSLKPISGSAQDILDSLQGFTWWIDHGCIFLRKAGQAPHSEHNVYCIYDVSDLVHVGWPHYALFSNSRNLLRYRPANVPTRFDVQAPRTNYPIPAGTEIEPQSKFTFEQLCQIIQNGIDSATWTDSEAATALRYNVQAGWLIVRQSRDNQSRIDKLLNGLRKL